jgi:hypothetical protein
VIISSDPVRQPAFEFARARGQHGHAAGTSPVAGGSDQPRFPDAGGTFHHEQAARTLARRRQLPQ